MQLYSSITTNPPVVIQNQTFSINFDVINTDSSTYSTDVAVDLYNEYGYFLRRLGDITNLSLDPNEHITLTLIINGGIPETPGTYQLAIRDLPGLGTYQLIGSGTYNNPINIKIKEPPPPPDIFEDNNIINEAYNLPLNFTADRAKVYTFGSNFHSGSDSDYYKITLPPGYSYIISCRIHDSNNSGNGSYTADGLLSYSKNGTIWPGSYDDSIPNQFLMQGGNTVYFLVSPYFQDNTGTYLLDATITRAVSFSSEKEITGFSLPGMLGTATINSATASIVVNVLESTNLTTLTPTITISNNATISPTIGTPNNFTKPVYYIVRAQDLSTKSWMVTVNKTNGNNADNNIYSNLINIYPNPATDELIIDLKDIKDKTQSFSLISIDGKKILAETQITGDSFKLNVATIDAGIYFLHIKCENGSIIKKVIIQ